MENLFPLLQSELENTRGSIRELLKSSDQILAVVVTGLAIGFAVLHGSHSRTTYMLLPLVVSLPGFYILRVNAMIQHLGGYRRALEESINQVVTVEVLVWEKTVAPLLKRSLASNLQSYAMVALWLSSVGFSYYEMTQTNITSLETVAFSVTYVAAGALLGISLIGSRRLFEKSYDVALPVLTNAVEFYFAPKPKGDAPPCSS